MAQSTSTERAMVRHEPLPLITMWPRERTIVPAEERRQLVERFLSLLELGRGPALNAGLDHLTRTERRVFDLLYLNQPLFMPAELLLETAIGHGYSVHVLRVNLSRLRTKLRGTGWRVEHGRSKGVYRLVEDQPVSAAGANA